MLLGLNLGLGHFFGSFMTWGFLISFLFNVFGNVMDFKKGYSTIIASLIVFLSYFSTDHFFNFDNAKPTLYLFWALIDVGTLSIIIIAHLFLKEMPHRATIYVFLGLTFNSFLLFGMYIDIWIMGNKSPWWFWGLYTYGINVVDYMMIIALITGKDFLGLVRLGRFIGSKIITKKEKSEGKQKEKRLSQQMLQA